MKTPNGKYLTIKTDGWLEMFEPIAASLQEGKRQTLISIMSPMIKKLEIPKEEYTVVVTYLHRWALEQLTKRGFQIVRGQNGGIFRKNKVTS